MRFCIKFAFKKTLSIFLIISSYNFCSEIKQAAAGSFSVANPAEIKQKYPHMEAYLFSEAARRDFNFAWRRQEPCSDELSRNVAVIKPMVDFVEQFGSQKPSDETLAVIGGAIDKFIFDLPKEELLKLARKNVIMAVARALACKDRNRVLRQHKKDLDEQKKRIAAERNNPSVAAKDISQLSVDDLPIVDLDHRGDLPLDPDLALWPDSEDEKERNK